MEILVTHDHMRRTVVVIPDDDARRLQRSVKDGWTELGGIARGESSTFPPGSWEDTTTRAILAAVAGSPEVEERGRTIATRGSFYGFIVGESGWSPEVSFWRNYETTRDLHVSGCPHVDSPRVGTYYAG